MINKLIVLVSLSLVLGSTAFIYLIVAMPEGKSIKGAIAEFLPAQPTPTLAPMFTQTAQPSATPTLWIIPTQAPTNTASITQTPPLSPTSTFAPVSETPVFTPTLLAVSPNDCIPDHPPKTGRVMEVLDGNTVRALIDGLVYVVRYIGVSTPKGNELYSQAARLKNSELVFGRDITLIPGTVEKDERGRLLYYVLVGDNFINLELIEEGFGSAVEESSNPACSQSFSDAEERARMAGKGQWALFQTRQP